MDDRDSGSSVKASQPVFVVGLLSAVTGAACFMQPLSVPACAARGRFNGGADAISYAGCIGCDLLAHGDLVGGGPLLYRL